MSELSGSKEYRVLARKYRPSGFDGLIGQDVLVSTLANAIETGRVAHAYMLTGVRGVGKTTTARIIARALNCTGADGNGGPTIQPCGECNNCISISEDRHIDVIEMDAASRTGVDDVRELIESVRYRPVSALYKIYIIDEVHMLSRNAFNALLKTLEEPPEQVKFIFATTEIRKVPVTVLSRCQRFDLRRVEIERLVEHFRWIAGEEGVVAEDEALHLIARAADGSVRDGLSLLDQALVPGVDVLESDTVLNMLGLADRTIVYDLFNLLMTGKIADALKQFDGMYRDGAEPLLVLQDILDVIYWLTRIKTSPAVSDAPYASEIERTRGVEMASQLSMSSLTRAWQMMLKGINEVQSAPNAFQASQMIMIRLAYAADLPSPMAAVRELTRDARVPGTTLTSAENVLKEATPTVAPSGGGAKANISSAPALAGLEPEAELIISTPELPQPESFKEVVDLFRFHREMILCSHLQNSVHLVGFEQGRIELRIESDAPRDLVNRVSEFLNEWTRQRWVVTVSSESGAPTLREQARREDKRLLDEAETDDLVQAVKEVFPGSKVTKVTMREPLEEHNMETEDIEDEDVAGID